MKWRCTWCGKPHAENDPPCDNCGHNTFEKAVVRADETREGQGAAAGDDTDGEPIPSGTVDTGPDYVWACTNCGREHVRNSPPCSRCGNPDLEKVEQTYEGLERDLETSSWLAVAKPYLPVLAVIGIVIALFATGIIPPSILPGIGPPSPPDAPGEGSEAAGIDLEATERAVHDRLEADRNQSESRTYDAGLADYAEYMNRAFVVVEYEESRPEPVEASDFGTNCQREPYAGRLPGTLSIADYDDEAALADDVVTALSEETGDSDFDREGLDLHVVDGSVYVFYAACSSSN
ncbi:hypothetical protein [Natrinema limicola]|uniref:Uncharacterized protein n=1 Tax=Natrinema limicola JCM 13563 TaxID=1230457 RepID=M0C5J2_9EURY|nr:hypothetical protein [Natrinema limicola]ELZ17587.1 hypothetical protein C476_14963 [Natrinema limicola JCM 13563]